MSNISELGPDGKNRLMDFLAYDWPYLLILSWRVGVALSSVSSGGNAFVLGSGRSHFRSFLLFRAGPFPKQSGTAQSHPAGCFALDRCFPVDAFAGVADAQHGRHRAHAPDGVVAWPLHGGKSDRLLADRACRPFAWSAVPGIAWIESSALLATLAVIGAILFFIFIWRRQSPELAVTRRERENEYGS